MFFSMSTVGKLYTFLMLLPFTKWLFKTYNLLRSLLVSSFILNQRFVGTKIAFDLTEIKIGVETKTMI